MQHPPDFDGAVATAAYAYPYDWFIRRLKFGGELPMARLLAELMVQRRPPGWPDAEVLAPVPLHRRRLVARGYDQAGELARELGRLLDLPVARRLLRRVRATSPQTGLSAAGRRKNLNNAFELRAAAGVPGRVCLVDDVMTTGATLDAASRALRAASAKQILVWVAARS